MPQPHHKLPSTSTRKPSGVPGVATLRRETSTIPVVFVNVGDPVGGGLISSLARTRNNITGFTAFDYNTAGKWLELLKEIAPQVARVAFVFGGAEFGPTGEGFYRALSVVAPSFAIELRAPRTMSVRDVMATKADR